MHPLRIWVGPVHSGKSTLALQAARRLERLKKRVCLVRPRRSVRDHEQHAPGHLVTKDGQTFPSHDVALAWDLGHPTAGYDAVWLDEPMLWPDEYLVFGIVQQIRRTRPVLISALSATSELQPFGSSLPQLLAVADDVTWCRADCDGCGNLGAATRSFFAKGRKAEQVAVGGVETYQAMCPDCWSAAMDPELALAGG